MTPVLDVLLSYAYHKTTDLAEVRDAIGPDARLMVDSGAFTAHSSGKPISLDAYTEFLETWAGVYDHAVTLDVIGDADGTTTNTRTLWDRGHRVLPVITVGTPFDTLKAYAADGHTYVAAGGLVGMKRQVVRQYLAELQRQARDHGCRIHALGVGGARLITLTGVYSGDSSSAAQAPAWGAVAVWNGNILNQLRVSDRAKLSEHRDWLVGCEVPFAEMLTGNVYKSREHRETMIVAGMYAFAAAGHVLRQRIPTGGDGPRVMSAVTRADLDAVMYAAQRIANDPPRSISRLPGVTV